MTRLQRQKRAVSKIKVSGLGCERVLSPKSAVKFKAKTMLFQWQYAQNQYGIRNEDTIFQWQHVQHQYRIRYKDNAFIGRRGGRTRWTACTVSPFASDAMWNVVVPLYVSVFVAEFRP